jgi:hypothetical protein
MPPRFPKNRAWPAISESEALWYLATYEPGPTPPSQPPPRPTRKITGARILAFGGTICAVRGTVGGFAGATWLIGVANAVMLAANLLVLSGRWA